MPIQSQGIITKDNVSVDVSAVAYYRVVDPIRSVIAIENVAEAINQIAQTTLRAVVGRHTLDETLSETDTINENIHEILDVQTEEWGIEVTLVELRDIQLPDSMKRAMARQAEAEREKRAKIIAAEGEALAAGELARASDMMMAHPLALQLRNLQTLVEIAVDKNSTVVFPRAADEHDRRTRRLPDPRDPGRRRAIPAPPMPVAAPNGAVADQPSIATINRSSHRPQTSRLWIEPRRTSVSAPRARGDVLTAISDGMVGLLKEFYGRGPTRTKSYYEDDLVVCVLRGGFSRVEQTLLGAAAARPSSSSGWSSRRSCGALLRRDRRGDRPAGDRVHERQSAGARHDV